MPAFSVEVGYERLDRIQHFKHKNLAIFSQNKKADQLYIDPCNSFIQHFLTVRTMHQELCAKHGKCWSREDRALLLS